MKFRLISMAAYLTALLGLASVATADNDPVVEKKSVIVLKSGSGGEVVIDSDDTGIHMDDLAEGETRSWVTDDGTEVSITRTNGSLFINKGGEEIVLDDFQHMSQLHDGHNAFAWSTDGDTDFHFGHGGFAFGDPGVTISSSDAIPEAARAEIKQVLADYGVDSEVRFISFGELSDLHGELEHNIEVIADDDGQKRVHVMRIHKDNGE